MMPIIVVLLLAPEPDGGLTELVRRAHEEASATEDNGGISKTLQPLATRIQKHGAAAVPLILPLLTDASPGVRNFAGYVVRDLPGLTAKELPALMAAHSSGNGWVAPAIASVGTPQAIEFLVSDFQQHPQEDGQLSWALSRLGARAAIPLAEVLRRKGPVAAPRDYVSATCGVLRDVKREELTAVETTLLSIAASDGVVVQNRAAAISLVRCIGGAAPSTRQALDTLVAAAPALAADDAVRETQMALGTRRGIELVREKLKRDPRFVALLAAVGGAAPEAEPDAIRLLGHSDPEIRNVAATALGVIGGPRSHEALTRALTDAVDWRLPCTAARSLATLGAVGSTDAVAGVAGSHWYPPVRDCAIATLDALRGKRPVEQQLEKWEVPRGDSWRANPTGREAAQPQALSASELGKLTTPADIVSYGPNGRKETKRIRDRPGFGLRFGGGILLGTNRGEWGGELLWAIDGTEATVLDKNVVGLHQLPGTAVVVTGLRHMSINEGAVYRIARTGAGLPKASLWRVLPGAPTRTVMLKNGALFVSCHGGDVVLMPTGELTLATDSTMR